MDDFDPAEIERWAVGCLTRLSEGGTRGVLMGGSIARGQQWKHSDLEAGLLVEQREAAIPYFNVDAGRGVEIIQLVAPELTSQMERVERGDLAPVAEWPIQMYKARVMSDPTGVLTRFVALFDRHLFSREIVKMKIARHVARVTDALEKARSRVAGGRPRAALCDVRIAMNEAVLALHWSLGELPRSHNRVDSRLRDLTARHGRLDFYALYREVFELETAELVIRRDWPLVRDRVQQIAANWKAKEFFETAVDGSFAWGENGGIISIHRLFIPMIGGPEFLDAVDRPEWAAENGELLRFLGLTAASEKKVGEWIERVARETGDRR